MKAMSPVRMILPSASVSAVAKMKLAPDFEPTIELTPSTGCNSGSPGAVTLAVPSMIAVLRSMLASLAPAVNK